MSRASLVSLVATVASCFADPPAELPDDEDSSATGIAGSEEGSAGPSGDPGSESGSASGASATTAEDTGADSSGDSAGSSGADEDSAGSTGDVPTFCDMVPPEIDLCRDFDGNNPLGDWGINEQHGEVDWTNDDPVSPPHALVTMTTPDPGGVPSNATVGSFSGGLPLPIHAGLVEFEMWIDPGCFETAMLRSVATLAWTDAVDPEGPNLYNLTFWVADGQVMIAESDSPFGDDSVEEVSPLDVVAGQWLPVKIDFAVNANVVVLTIDGVAAPALLNLANSDLLAQIEDVPLQFALGQSGAVTLPSCTIRYDDFTIDLP